MINYDTKGVCARNISYEINNGKIYNVHFNGGCNGNLKAISKLVDGMEVNKVIELLNNIDCNGRGTSCADQLSKSLIERENKNGNN